MTTKQRQHGGAANVHPHTQLMHQQHVFYSRPRNPRLVCCWNAYQLLWMLLCFTMFTFVTMAFHQHTLLFLHQPPVLDSTPTTPRQQYQQHIIQPHQHLSLKLQHNNTDQTRSKTLATIESILPGLQKYSKDEACRQFHSPAWLQGSRVGNTPLAPPNFLLFSQTNTSKKPIDVSPLLQETLCWNASRWVLDTTNVRLWTTRLVYLALYWHQHAPAYSEFAATTSSESCSRAIHAQRTHHQVGPGDYECPDAKFLVTALSDHGLGANARLTAVSALKAALSTGRVAVFVNDIFSAVNASFLQSPWVWTSASFSCPRRDVQCLFRPLTPCVLLEEEEIVKAHVLTLAETRQLFRQGVLPAPHQEDRVVVLRTNARPQRNPPQLQSVLYHLAQQVLSLSSSSSLSYLQDNPSVRQGLERLLRPDPLHSNLFEGDYEINHALTMYALRPLPVVSQKVDEIVQRVLQTQSPTNPTLLDMGLAVRGSDKCESESECMGASDYMMAASELYQDKLVSNSNISGLPSLVITTEDKDLLHDFQRFDTHQSANAEAATATRFQTIYNEFDVLQSTGWMKPKSSPSNASLDQIMISALSSLQLQLLPRQLLGNCCSNFFLLLADLRNEGCGLTEDDQDPVVTTSCLQEHPNQAYRLCCAWDRSERCQARRLSPPNYTTLQS